MCVTVKECCAPVSPLTDETCGLMVACCDWEKPPGQMCDEECGKAVRHQSVVSTNGMG